jgi:hypothetical protein
MEIGEPPKGARIGDHRLDILGADLPPTKLEGSSPVIL